MDITKEPIAATDEPLSPRELGLSRAGRLLQIGGLLNGGLAILLALLGVLAGISNSGLFETLADALIGGYGGAADTALLVMLLLALGNLSAVLVVMVGVLAQEFWAPVAVWALVAANGWLLLSVGFIPGLLSIGVAAWAGVIVVRDLGAYRFNPLMLKELRERMRGARAFVVITVYLGLMSGFTVLLYLLETNAGSASGTSVTGELGRNLFRGVVGLELLLIVFIAPAFTSGAIANERERKTYDLLNITLLPHQSFVIGKLESALGYVLLLLLAAIPLQSIAFLFGGVTEQELILAFVILAVTAVVLGTVGLFFSTMVDRTLTASVRSYTVIFAAMVAVPLGFTFFLDIIEQVIDVGIDTPAPVQAFFVYARAFVDSLNPITAALETQNLLVNNQGAGFYLERLRDGTTIPLASPWISFTILSLTTAAVLIVFSVQAMRRSDDA